MNDASDQQLLRDYADRRSEAAFTELVRRHVDFVYSAARRMVNDSQLAEDVTQGVFVALGQNARRLTDRAVLAGWLHRTTRNLAAKAVRTEVRRRAREQEAVAMNELVSPATEPAWEHIAPHLDAALDKLGDVDRDAVLLRYIEHKTAREVGQTLGLSEEAAQKRVSRALDKLRGHFARKGFAVSATVIASIVTSNAVQAAPVGLATTVASASLAGVTGGATTFTLKLMETIMAAKLKFTIAALIAAGAVVTPIILSQKTGQNEELETILRHSDEKLASYKSWSVDVVVMRSTSNGQPRVIGKTAFQAPDLLRIENEMPTQPATAGTTKQIMVKGADGILWSETSQAGQRRVSKVRLLDSINLNYYRLFGVMHPVEEWKFYREVCDLRVVAKAELDGQLMYVLEGAVKETAKTDRFVATWAKMEGRNRLYLGVEDGFLHKIEVFPPGSDTAARSWEYEYRNLKFNEVLPASLFVYTPPEGVEVIVGDVRGRAQ